MDLWRRRVDCDAIGTHGLRGLEGLVVGDHSAVVGPGARHGPTGVRQCRLIHLRQFKVSVILRMTDSCPMRKFRYLNPNLLDNILA